MNKIKELREGKKMTQSELASKLGYSRTMITKWETNVLEPTKGQKIDICEALDVPLEHLIASERIHLVRSEYIKHISYRNKMIISAFLEDALYLLGCIILAIINNSNPIPYFLPIIISLLSISIVGTIYIAILLSKNVKKISSDLKMKYWYIKGWTSKSNLKKVIANNEVDAEFNKLLLNHKVPISREKIKTN